MIKLSNILQVLLLEAGDEEPLVAEVPGYIGFLSQSNIDYDYRFNQYTSVCRKNKVSCAEPRGKVMGGTSVLNGMGYVRGNKEDYDDWMNLGNPGWGWNEVLYYFKKSENLRSVSHYKYH